jgi:hypothetical protein
MVCGPFNGSVWHAPLLLFPAWLLVFVWHLCKFKGPAYHFDPKRSDNPKLLDAGDYERHSQRYQDLARLAITISGAAIAFLISIMARDSPVPSEFATKVRDVAPIVCGLFGLCIGLLVAFMVLQSIWYEEYCHSPDHSSYSGSKYAFSTSLWVTGLSGFVLGFLWLAANLF